MTVPDVRIRAADSDAIAEAAALVSSGNLVAFPTETVYGVGADATNDKAVATLFAVKKRPRFNPLIVHFASPEAAAQAAAFDDRARALSEAFWPGALTLVLKRQPSSRLSLLVSSGLETLAVRVPDHPIAEALLTAADCPIAAPSANRSGCVSPTTAAHVVDSLGGRIAMILDGGACRVGVESTVLDLTGRTPALLRPGGLAVESVESVVGPVAAPDDRGAPKSPGMLSRHYAPGIPIRLNAAAVRPGEALLAFGMEALQGTAEATLNLSPTGDLEEAAANLFAMIRALDRPRFAAIAVMPVPERGLGHAINDRLRRAAEPAGVSD